MVLARVVGAADAAGIGGTITIDPSVVRGLSYYTGTRELFDASGDLPRAIAGGGRYDRLIETLGGKSLPMVGFGFGDVVITDSFDPACHPKIVKAWTTLCIHWRPATLLLPKLPRTYVRTGGVSWSIILRVASST